MAHYLFVDVILLIGLSCMLWLVIDGFRTGAVAANRGGGMYSWGAPLEVERKKRPLCYWSLMGLYALSAAVQAGLLVGFVFFAH